MGIRATARPAGKCLNELRGLRTGRFLFFLSLSLTIIHFHWWESARPVQWVGGENRSESTAATICHHANQSVVTGQSRPDLRERNTPAFASRGIIRLAFRRTNDHRFLSVALRCVAMRCESLVRSMSSQA